jgi:hypothetical protein
VARVAVPPGLAGWRPAGVQPAGVGPPAAEDLVVAAAWSDEVLREAGARPGAVVPVAMTAPRPPAAPLAALKAAWRLGPAKPKAALTAAWRLDPAKPKAAAGRPPSVAGEGALCRQAHDPAGVAPDLRQEARMAGPLPMARSAAPLEEAAAEPTTRSRRGRTTTCCPRPRPPPRPTCPPAAGEGAERAEAPWLRARNPRRSPLTRAPEPGCPAGRGGAPRPRRRTAAFPLPAPPRSRTGRRRPGRSAAATAPGWWPRRRPSPGTPRTPGYGRTNRNAGSGIRTMGRRSSGQHPQLVIRDRRAAGRAVTSCARQRAPLGRPLVHRSRTPCPAARVGANRTGPPIALHGDSRGIPVDACPRWASEYSHRFGMSTHNSGLPQRSNEAVDNRRQPVDPFG